MSITMDAMSGSTLKRRLAQKLSVMMFTTLLLQVTVNAVPVEDAITDNSDIDNDCECVPFYLCINNTINYSGDGILDIRLQSSSKCPHYTERCCKNVGQPGGKVPTEETPPTEEQKHIMTCGHRNSGGVVYKITGDTDNEAEFGEFPWMIMILNLDPRTKNQTNLCGGSLIHPQVVLTAAHCLNNKDKTNLVIRAGEWDSRTENEWYKHQDRKVMKIIKHEQFDYDTGFNDVALIIVTEPFQILPHVSTICLPSQDFVFSDERCYASGWGKNTFDNSGKYQNILKKIDLPIVPRDPCLRSLRKTILTENFQLHKSLMCAGGEVGKDTCKGDGGGPLVCPIDKKSTQYVQAGIVVYGVECGTQAPGVYANVTMFRNWIDEKMKNENLETHYYDSKSDKNT